MFGLNDNSNKTSADVAPTSASGSTAMPPLSTNVPDNNSNTTSPPPSFSSAPPAPVDAPAKSTSAPEPPTALATPPVPVQSGGISDVNLENAYVDTSLAQATATTTSKPTAASLLDNNNDDELIKIKQQALQSLAPLVDHLDQTDEEKFKTTMMLIQASDNADLIPEAYEAAGKITDEKVRAQALLDVVNEINYFTQHNSSSQPADS